MGMPGSENALEEVVCRILGPLVQDGSVAKITDDLYSGSNTHQELLYNWKRVLQALHKCNLRLSAHKTIISPKTTTILGWIWNAGSLSASPHRLKGLATYPVPNTVARLRSFIGANKVPSRVIPRCSIVHGPIVISVSTRRTKDDCCELIAHKVEIENLYGNLSVGVAFRVFFHVKVPEMTFEIPTSQLNVHLICSISFEV